MKMPKLTYFLINFKNPSQKVPNRNEPDSPGELNFEWLFGQLKKLVFLKNFYSLQKTLESKERISDSTTLATLVSSIRPRVIQWPGYHGLPIISRNLCVKKKWIKIVKSLFHLLFRGIARLISECDESFFVCSSVRRKILYFAWERKRESEKRNSEIEENLEFYILLFREEMEIWISNPGTVPQPCSSKMR